MNLFKFNFQLPAVAESLKTVVTDPKIYITLISVLIFIAVFLYISKLKLSTKVLIQVALAIAMGTVLKMFRIMDMPMGGSVTLGSMVPIIFVAYLYGPRVGCMAGIVFGILDLLLGAYVVHPIQLLLDYILAFGALGIAGYFKNHILIGSVAAISLRFFFHVVSGVVFFSSYAGKQNVVLYSILYNGTYLLPEAIITALLLYLIPLKRLKGIILNQSV